MERVVGKDERRERWEKGEVQERGEGVSEGGLGRERATEGGTCGGAMPR
jgi:hypothetical protein